MNHLKVLGLTSEASLDDVKTAYRKAMMLYHPDRPTANAAKFDACQKAYRALTDFCRDCDGTGVIKTRRGAIITKTNCPKCWSAIR